MHTISLPPSATHGGRRKPAGRNRIQICINTLCNTRHTGPTKVLSNAIYARCLHSAREEGAHKINIFCSRYLLWTNQPLYADPFTLQQIIFLSLPTSIPFSFSPSLSHFHFVTFCPLFLFVPFSFSLFSLPLSLSLSLNLSYCPGLQL